MKKLLSDVLERITPSKEEHEFERKLIKEIKNRLIKKGANPILVGSLAKDTDIRGDKDIDLFILFNPEIDRAKLEEEGLRIGKELFTELGGEYEIDYAEHPYVKGLYKGYIIEIVPCYDIKKPKSAVDRTPYHTQYVKKKIQDNQHLNGEIRLLKQFMKGIGVYGAEAKVEGFSGYLTELLVIAFGSFEDTLKAAAKWKFDVALDSEDLWKDKESLRFFFPDASLIVVDPIDENRNAAAAVSRQRLAEFIVSANRLIELPSADFFFVKQSTIPDKKELSLRIKSRETKLFALVFNHPNINSNTLYSQLRKTENILKKSVHELGFRILKSGFWTDEVNRSIILFDFEVWSLPNIKHQIGPSIEQDPRDQRRFTEKYSSSKPYISKGRWAVETQREFKEVEKLLLKLITERKGFGKNLRIVEKIEIINGENIIKIDDKGFIGFMDSFLSPL